MLAFFWFSESNTPLWGGPAPTILTICACSTRSWTGMPKCCMISTRFFFESLSFRNPAVKWGMPRKDFCFGKSGWDTIFASLWTWGARKERNLGEATLQAKTGNGGGFACEESRGHCIWFQWYIYSMNWCNSITVLHFAFDCPPPLWEIIANLLLTIQSIHAACW